MRPSGKKNVVNVCESGKRLFRLDKKLLAPANSFKEDLFVKKMSTKTSESHHRICRELYQCWCQSACVYNHYDIAQIAWEARGGSFC